MLVFVQSIERAKELFHELIYDGMNVDVIHSERTKAQRDNVIKSFREGKVSNRAYELFKSITIRIIIVTCAFSLVAVQKDQNFPAYYLQNYSLE